MSDKAVQYAINEWGWVDPTSDVIESAEVQLYVIDHALRSGDIISHLGIMKEERVNEILDNHTSRSGEHVKFLDKIVQGATQEESKELTAKRNRILSFVENVQYFDSFDDGYVQIHPKMSDKAVLENCKSLNAVLVQIQGTNPVLVFSDLGSFYREIYGIADIDKGKHAVFKEVEGHIRLGVAANPEMIISAQKRSSDGIDIDTSAREVLVHNNLMEEGLTRPLAVLHQVAINKEATDIHITPDPINGMVVVEIRVFGKLIQLPDISPSKDEYRGFKEYLLGKSKAVRNAAALTEPADGEYGYLFEGQRINFRASFIPLGTDDSFINNDVSIRLRILPSGKGAIKLKELEIDEKVIKHMRKSMYGRAGLVLMVGATGTGKSTSLLGLVEVHREIFGDSKSRLSLEDPVERQVPGITQFSIKRRDKEDDKVTFEKYLRSFVRHDPDYMMLGEIRDGYTARFAANAAVTGHKTTGTIHGSSTIEATERLLNMIDNRDQKTMVINSITHLFAQRLVPILCPECKHVRAISEVEKDFYEDLIDKHSLDISVPTEVAEEHKGGCAHCKNIGYIKRVPVNEVLEFTPEVKRIALSNDADRFEQLKSKRDITIESMVHDHVLCLETPIDTFFEE